MATGDDELRKSRGLGFLLASMGNNKDKRDTKKRGIKGVTKRTQDEYEGFDPESSGFSGWDDISCNQNTAAAAGYSKMGTQQCNNEVTMKGKSGNSSAGVQREETTPGTQKQKSEGRNKRKLEDEMRRFEESVYGPSNMSSWSAMKEYDDDHDRQWFEDENTRLAELYGGSFICAKYMDSQPGKVGYYCELCFAEMNARKSLDLHCSGMKHLKKKSMWEKGHGHDGGGDNGRSERGSRPPPRQPSHQPPPQPSHQPPPQPPSQSQPYGWSNRGPPPLDSYRGPRPPVERSPYREPRSPEFRHDNRGHSGRRDDYNRHHHDNYEEYPRREPGPYRPPFIEDSYDRRRGSPPGPDRRDVRDRFSRERFSPYVRREAPPPPVISSPPRSDNGRIPPLDGGSGLLFEGIADGSCCELLKRLAVCRVKNMEDSALALNVATFLVMSLKDYYNSSGSPSVTHILQEIVIKIGIVKDLLKIDTPLLPS